MVAPAIPLPQSLPRYTATNVPMPGGLQTNLDGASALANRRDDGAPADWKGGRNDNLLGAAAARSTSGATANSRPTRSNRNGPLPVKKRAVCLTPFARMLLK